MLSIASINPALVGVVVSAVVVVVVVMPRRLLICSCTMLLIKFSRRSPRRPLSNSCWSVSGTFLPQTSPQRRRTGSTALMVESL